jgi:hypothetical protein
MHPVKGSLLPIAALLPGLAQSNVALLPGDPQPSSPLPVGSQSPAAKGCPVQRMARGGS